MVLLCRNKVCRILVFLITAVHQRVAQERDNGRVIPKLFRESGLNLVVCLADALALAEAAFDAADASISFASHRCLLVLHQSQRQK